MENTLPADRRNSMLTKKQRKFLRGEVEYEGEYAKQKRYHHRKEIRERVRNGILDFEILNDHLERGELERIFQLEEDGEPVTQPIFGKDGVTEAIEMDPEIVSGLAEMIAFVFRTNPGTDYIENMTKRGVELGLTRLGIDAEVGDVDIPVEVPKHIEERIDDHMNDGVALSETEIRVALERSVRPPNEVAEYVQEYGTRPENVTPQMRENFAESVQNVVDDMTWGQKGEDK